MLYRTIALVACLCAAANAFVDYGDAILYDENDLLVRTFPIPECLFASCKVYVSAPESSLPTLAQIYIGDTPLTTLARNTDSETGLKTPYNIKGYSGKAVFSNFNVKTPYTKFITAPVAVYVVYERATFFNTALVYEPSSAPVTVNWSNATTLTLLSATNFTAKGEVKQGVLAFGRVVSAGFDSVQRNLARIPALYEFSDDKLTLRGLLKPKAFEFSANTPLITLYSPFAASSVDVTIVSGFQDSSSSPLFLTSPGYTGVLSGQVYRSSLYANSVRYRLAYEQETTIHFKTFLNTFTDAVELTVDGGEKQTLRGTRGLSSYHQLFDVNGKDLEISFTKNNPLSSFLLRIAAEVDEPETTHRTPEEVKELIKDLLKNHTRAPSEDVTKGPETPDESTHRTPEEIKNLIKDKLKERLQATAEPVVA